MTLLLDRPDVQVFHADWRGLLDVLPRRDDGTVCDALIVDAPYSERTHAGHDVVVEHLGAATNQRRRTERRAIDYDAWSPDHVRRFVGGWAAVTRGWFVALTDHVLALDWADALDDSGRYVFAPIPFVAPGSRVRLSGDGPSSWTTWIIVARPRARAMMSWGTLAGAYVGPPERQPVVGGKPHWLMRALVRDYTRPGDLVCDPCCGAGTTLLAAVMEGRRAVGGDALEAHAQMAARRLGGLVQQPLFGGLG